MEAVQDPGKEWSWAVQYGEQVPRYEDSALEAACMHVVCVTSRIEASFGVVHNCNAPCITHVKGPRDTAEVEEVMKCPMKDAVDGCL